MQRTKDRIELLDPNVENQTYAGGCEFLLDWYRDTVQLMADEAM